MSLNYRNYIILVAMLLLATSSIVAQDFAITHYDVKDGMSNGPKRCMVQDDDGYLWIGSTSGINRFDGKNFKIYTGDITDSTNFNAYHFKSLDIDSEGNLWACLMEGIFMYDKDEDRFFRQSQHLILPHDMPIPAFTDLIFVNKKLYISSFVGLHIYDPQDDTWEYIDFTPDVIFEGWHTSPKSLWNLRQDIYNPNIINLFGRSMYFKYDIQSKKVVQQIKIPNKYDRDSDIVQSKQMDEDRFWLSSYGNGLILYNRNTELTEYQLLDESLEMDPPLMVLWDFIEVDQDNYLLANLRGESIVLNTKSLSWKYYKLDGMVDKYSSIIKDVCQWDDMDGWQGWVDKIIEATV